MNLVLLLVFGQYVGPFDDENEMEQNQENKNENQT
jgi:hypothetical protein